MTDIFFEKLSYRFRNENDLSDITWALAESSPYFQQLFINFFFTDLPALPIIQTFKREHSEGDCRPDFYIIADDIEYIIECKINDRNQHFQQYKNTFPNAKFGYITNYPLTQQDDSIVIKEWKDFKDYLSNSLSSSPVDEQSKFLISGYIQYIISICGIFNLCKMNLTNLSSLYHFNNLIKKIVVSLENRESFLYNQGKPFDTARSGQYFSLKLSNGETIYPWLGIYYTTRICIYLEFNWKWCRSIFELLNDKEVLSGQFHCAPEYDKEYGAAFCFELKEEFFNLFNSDTSTVEEQEQIIRKFVQEVLSSVGL